MSVPPIHSITVHSNAELHFSTQLSGSNQAVLDIFVSVHRIPVGEEEEWEIKVRAWKGSDQVYNEVTLGSNDGAQFGDYIDVLLPRDGVFMKLPQGVSRFKNNPVLKVSSLGGALVVQSPFNLVEQKTPPPSNTSLKRPYPFTEESE